jgi:hypothetical protein
VRGVHGTGGIGDDQRPAGGGEDRPQPGGQVEPLAPGQVLVAQDERERPAAQRQRDLLGERARAPRQIRDDEQPVFHAPDPIRVRRMGRKSLGVRLASASGF